VLIAVPVAPPSELCPECQIEAAYGMDLRN